MGGDQLGLVMVIGVLLAMVPNTMQLRGPFTQLRSDFPFLGVVLSGASEEKLLLESGKFVPSVPIKKAGRTFVTGDFNGLPTVYVIASAPLAHASATVQLLIDSFNVYGIIDYGNAAAVNPSFNLADVAVLSETAFTSAWTWKENEGKEKASDNELPSLKIGDYNVPKAGKNKLGSIKYNKVKKYTPEGSKKETFWYYIDPKWLDVASQLKDINLESCTDDNGQKLCTKEIPSVKFGVKGSTSDIYVQNEAYAKFLHEELDVSTADRRSAATVSTAVANGIPHIVFRAASNKPGEKQDPNLSALARKNVLKVVSEFVDIIANERPISDASIKLPLKALSKYIFY